MSIEAFGKLENIVKLPLDKQMYYSDHITRHMTDNGKNRYFVKIMVSRFGTQTQSVIWLIWR